MAHERLSEAALPQTVANLAGHLADLFQTELRLLRAELSARGAAKLRGAAWMVTAAGMALVAALFVLQALAFGIASYGIAMHWACLIVGGALGMLAVAIYLKGRVDAETKLTPERALAQVRRDLATAKEQLR